MENFLFINYLLNLGTKLEFDKEIIEYLEEHAQSIYKLKPK